MKFLKNAKLVTTSEFYYDLFVGGYIDPRKLLVAKDAAAVEEAIEIINTFENELDKNDLLDYI